MVVHSRSRSILGHLGLWLVTAAAVAYFGHHAFNGAHGIKANRTFEAESAALTLVLDRMRLERRSLEHRAELLGSKALDPDLLEEEARGRLGWLNPRDRVLLLP